MKAKHMFVLMATVAMWTTASAQVAGDSAVQNQWFTGSLEAPSPALPQAGLLAVEPYLIYTDYNGAYGPGGGHLSTSDGVRQSATVVALKYAITDRLTVQALPSAAHVWIHGAAATGTGDLPVELEYRFNEENRRTGSPSVTAALGLNLPVGNYERLHSSVGGFGSGAWTLRGSLLLQSLFDTPGNHPMRLRFYGEAFEPLGNVPVHDLSVYGTAPGFQGHAVRGFASEFGIGAGYALNRRCVLAFDMVANYSDGFHLAGSTAADAQISTRAQRTSSIAVATAVEYNWSGRIGVIAGVEFSVAGRNTASFVAPQIALSMAF